MEYHTTVGLNYKYCTDSNPFEKKRFRSKVFKIDPEKSNPEAHLKPIQKKTKTFHYSLIIVLRKIIVSRKTQESCSIVNVFRKESISAEKSISFSF